MNIMDTKKTSDSSYVKEQAYCQRSTTTSQCKVRYDEFLYKFYQFIYCFLFIFNNTFKNVNKIHFINRFIRDRNIVFHLYIKHSCLENPLCGAIIDVEVCGFGSLV